MIGAQTVPIFRDAHRWYLTGNRLETESADRRVPLFCPMPSRALPTSARDPDSQQYLSLQLESQFRRNWPRLRWRTMGVVCAAITGDPTREPARKHGLGFDTPVVESEGRLLVRG